MLKKPQNVYMPIDRLQAKVLKRKDPVKKAEWVDNFVLALSEEAEDPFAKELLEKAQFDYYKDTLRTWRLKAKKSLSFNGNEPSDKQIHEWCCEEYGDEYIEALHLLSKNSKRFSKKIQNLLSNNPQDAPNGNAGVDRKSATSCDQFTADGDVREDSHDGKSGTSANLYGPRQAKNGDAPHREAGDESTTVSKNMRRAPQNEAPAHGFSGGRTAQGTMSRSPEAAAQSGKDYDQETIEISTDEKDGCGPLEKTNSQKSPQPSLFPVAKPEKRRYGKYRHVLLTDEEGRKLRESLGEDLEDAVAILDDYIQDLPVKAKGAKKNGAKWWMQEYEAKDHYNILHHGWAREKLNEIRTKELNARAAELRCSAAETNAKAAEKRLENANSSSQPRQMYLTSDDISRRNAEEGWRQLQLMHQMEGNG